uniref:Uncharacterized protein LOC111101422 n=1 Tax=Crassostrea virginica TaxID=6565 RepID=A0A8B8AGG9_CRAVI|nr:uncharacterized protein LOC111101422 [Crassostrea virginica]
MAVPFAEEEERNKSISPKPKLILYVYVLFTTFLLMSHVLVGETSSSSCPVSRKTVQTVDSCPENEEDWKKAAERKNCFQNASQCDEPARLVYHCVINPYVNETLEVCAYSQIIVFGQCTEYDIVGNSIQGNEETNCTGFSPKPCPNGYNSSEMFKYPGCFDLVKPSATNPPTSTLGSRDSVSYSCLAFVFLQCFIAYGIPCSF